MRQTPFRVSDQEFASASPFAEMNILRRIVANCLSELWEQSSGNRALTGEETTGHDVARGYSYALDCLGTTGTGIDGLLHQR